MTEEWKDITGFEGFYQISNLGRVKSLARHYLAGRKYAISVNKIEVIRNTKPSGNLEYHRVTLSVGKIKTTQMVSRLVAKHFISNPENKPEVNHINGDKNDNRACNLEWCTRSENTRHAFDTGLQKPHAPWNKGKTHSREQVEKWRKTFIANRLAGKNQRDPIKQSIAAKKAWVTIRSKQSQLQQI